LPGQNQPMPIFKLDKDEIKFPPAQFADSEGLLCEGAGLTPLQLLAAYRGGFYFWFHPMRYIQWWSPDPRIILWIEDLSVPEYLTAQFEKLNFEVTYDRDLEGLMRFIQKNGNAGEMNEAWVTERTIRIFKEFHKEGYVHSIEIRVNRQLAGGLYGVAIGKVFFAEYIFGTTEYAREYALIKLAEKLKTEDFILIDLHKETNETIDLGLSEISRNEYLDVLKKNEKNHTIKGDWSQ